MWYLYKKYRLNVNSFLSFHWQCGAQQMLRLVKL